MTLRCDSNSAENVAFGGPIFYGHAPNDEEEADHPGNVFWPQAVEANKIYTMLDGKQHKLAEVATTPSEQKVAFQGGEGQFAGIPITELSADQRGQMQVTLKKLIEPFRQSDQQEALECLERQGGLDACNLAFFTDHDIGKDQVWDNWRLEGPAFVWHFQVAPPCTCGSISPTIPASSSMLNFLGSWFLVLGAWFLVLGAWFLVLGSGAWFLVLGAWCLVLGAWCLVLGAWSK
ncbi:MAG: hypothetical protein R3C56_00075 [Pirellulaceae bacterium]